MLPIRHESNKATVPNTTRDPVLIALLDTGDKKKNEINLV